MTEGWNLSRKLKTSTNGDTGIMPGSRVDIARR